ncbi:MAG: hypothetical protein ACLFNO_04005, partial [Parcubacteria group bacterium]
MPTLIIKKQNREENFKKGQSVIFQKRMRAEIVAVVSNVDKPYGIVYETPKGEKRTIFTTKEHLSRAKKVNELKKGDKFIDDNGNLAEIIFKTQEGNYSKTTLKDVVYICRLLNARVDKVVKYYPHNIEKII